VSTAAKANVLTAQVGVHQVGLLITTKSCGDRSRIRNDSGIEKPSHRCQPWSLSEIEICTPYVVAERLIVALMLRFKPAKNVLSDTLIPIHLGSLGGVWPDPFNWPEDARSFCYLYRQHVNGE
jgi:hypothetical protein